jgi:folylpolyglutamate synthase/dihydropteroate synthase
LKSAWRAPDATNVEAGSLGDYEHWSRSPAISGRTLEQIAAEKAGIIKSTELSSASGPKWTTTSSANMPGNRMYMTQNLVRDARSPAVVTLSWMSRPRSQYRNLAIATGPASTRQRHRGDPGRRMSQAFARRNERGRLVHCGLAQAAGANSGNALFLLDGAHNNMAMRALQYSGGVLS